MVVQQSSSLILELMYIKQSDIIRYHLIIKDEVINAIQIQPMLHPGNDVGINLLEGI
jgi:hypothetical protein